MSAIEDASVDTPAIETAHGIPSVSLTKAPRTLWKQRPAWYGVGSLALLTAYFTQIDSPNLFTFNLCLLAAFGAISLNVLKGTAGLISIGNAGFMAVGAFVSMYCLSVGVPFPFDVLLGTLAAAVAGFFIGSPAVRLRGMQLFLATMAGHFIILHFASEYQRHSSAGVGFFVDPLYMSKGIEQTQIYWAWTLLVLLSLLILGATRLVSERSGRAWRMIRDHEVAAHTLGIQVTRYKMLAFVMSSAVIGFQGGVIAHFTGSVSTEGYTFTLAISFVVMVIIGGLDSVAGACIGAAAVTALPVVLPNLVSGVLGEAEATANGPAYTTIVYGLLVIVFITMSPNGIIGFVRQLRSLAERKVGGRCRRRWLREN
jgi:branched-chain amino acid transport system permease protein